jgi:hypothetical protein
VSALVSEQEAVRREREAERQAMKVVLASLERVRDQRSASAVNARGIAKAHIRGEVAGLTIAINAIKRRLRP